MTHYLLGPILTLCLWVGLLIWMWDGGLSGGGVVVAALILAFILTLPAAFCAGLVWRLGEAIYDWWR